MTSFTLDLKHKTLTLHGESIEDFHVRLVAERARRYFLDFIRLVKPTWDLPWFHLRLVREIQSWADSAEPYGLILSLPPGHAKSTYAKLAVAWQLVRDPDHHVAYASYAQTLAEQQVSGLFEILDDEVFISYFGQFLNQKRVVTDESRGSKRTQDYAEIVGHSGWIKAVGRGAGLTGFRVSLAVVDDLLKDASEARSASVERETREWFTRTLSTRKMVDRPLRMLVLATRWGVGDLSGWLLSEQPDRWVEVRFPALKEGDPTPHDPRMEGEALWSSVATSEDLLRQKALDPEGFQALYQQSPVAEGGNLFRSEWLTRRWTTIPERDGTWLQSWDLRGGGSASKGSWAVGQLWFRPSQSSDLYLVDQVRGRWSPDETYSVIKKQNEDPLWSQAKAKLVEKKADGVGALSILSREISGLIGILPSSDKETRARGITAYFAASNVILPAEAHWLPDFISELLSFPASQNDDQVDATSQALDYFASHRASGPPKVVSVGSRASDLRKY